MKSNVILGRIFGVEVGLHFSWLIIALLITLSLSDRFQTLNPGWGIPVVWTTSILTSALFFGSLLAHELSHALVARLHGITTRAITLFALGGVAQIEGEPTTARAEFWIGIIGPISSAVIGVVSLGVALLLGWRTTTIPHTPPQGAFVWLGFINLGLAAFNMVPGFPLDGGRILHAIIWWVNGKRDRSTQLAARIGQAVGVGFIVLGIVRYFAGEGFGGLWIAFIGWFLLQAASASYATTTLTSSLAGVRVRDLMTRDCERVDGRTNLANFVNDYLLTSGKRCFIVEENNAIIGLVTPLEVTQVDKARWPYTILDEIMRPLEELHTVEPDTPVMQALETMGKDDVNQLPVVVNNRVEGVITRGNVLQFLQTRAELSR